MQTPVVLIASGDLRLSANQKCWEAQENVEKKVIRAIQAAGRTVQRGHEFDPIKRHGFIDSQKYGMEVFREIPANAPLVVVEAVWQYTHHLLHGLMTHRGPILTVANWSGEWPGLVGLLNLNASLSKAGVPYSTLWSENFRDELFTNGLSKWLAGQPVAHDLSHVQRFDPGMFHNGSGQIGEQVALELRRDKAIMGIFDEGCMGMYNAIIPDELLHSVGIFKERLSQSALYAEMMQTSNDEALAVRAWLEAKGMRFLTGARPERDLTDEQILGQCKMYIGALRIADDFGCDTVGIQYQQGLKDIAPASDLAEGLLNNVDRPPVTERGGTRILYQGKALPHFNEVDECAGLDALITNRVWTRLGFEPETTLHDIRYGEFYRSNGKEEYVWVFEISGAVPPQHLIGGYSGAVSERQPAMYFPYGGGTIKGVSKPGEIVWSRIYVEGNKLNADIGRGKVVELPRCETERRWQITTSQWPIMHAVTYGVTRDQMMAKHKANHIQVAYAPDNNGANLALASKAAAFLALGIDVNLCGSNHGL